MNFVAVLLSLLVGLFILLGSLISIFYKNNKKFTDFSISIAFGVIIGLIILEILPETFEVLNEEIGVIRSIASIIILILIGITMLKILDLFIPHHEHELHVHNKNSLNKNHNQHLHHIGLISSFAVIVHNIIEGMSLYLVTNSSISSGLFLFIGIGLHNIPMGLVIASTLISSNYTKSKTLKLSLIVSLSTFLGGLVMLLLGGVSNLVQGILLGLTLGMLIYISIFELMHQIYHMKDKKIPIIGIILGLLLLGISFVIELVM